MKESQDPRGFSTQVETTTVPLELESEKQCISVTETALTVKIAELKKTVSPSGIAPIDGDYGESTMRTLPSDPSWESGSSVCRTVASTTKLSRSSTIPSLRTPYQTQYLFVKKK